MLDLCQGRALFLLVAWQILYTLGRLDELDRVQLAHNLARVLSLQILFADVPRLVVKQAVRIALPSHASEENSIEKNRY